MWLGNRGLCEGRRNCKSGDGEPEVRAMSNTLCKFQVEAIQWEEKMKILGTNNYRTQPQKTGSWRALHRPFVAFRVFWK